MPFLGNHWLKKNVVLAAFIMLSCGAVSVYAVGAHDAYPLSKAQVRQAAHAGDADAEYAWGYMLYYGKDGVTPNQTEAMVWFHKAAAKGQPQAIQALEIFRRAEKPLKAGPSATHGQVAAAAEKAIDHHEKTMHQTPMHAHDTMPFEHKPVAKSHEQHPAKVNMTHRVIVPAEKDHVPVSHSALHHVPVHAKPKPAMTTHHMPVHHAPAAHHGAVPPSKAKMVIPPKMFDQLLARNHKVLMHRSSDAFSIQLVASHHFDKLLEFARTKEELMRIPSLHPLIFYRTMRGHQPWYVLLGGSYKDHAQAKHVLGLLGHQLSPIKPFIKSMRAVKAELAHS